MKRLRFALAAVAACASTAPPAPAPQSAPLASAAPPAFAPAGALATEDVAARIARVEHGLLRGARIQGVPGAALEDRMRAHHVHGLSVAVVDGYRVVWPKAYGLADAEQRVAEPGCRYRGLVVEDSAGAGRVPVRPRRTR